MEPRNISTLSDEEFLDGIAAIVSKRWAKGAITHRGHVCVMGAASLMVVGSVDGINAGENVLGTIRAQERLGKLLYPVIMEQYPGRFMPAEDGKARTVVKFNDDTRTSLDDLLAVIEKAKVR